MGVSMPLFLAQQTINIQNFKSSHAYTQYNNKLVPIKHTRIINSQLK